MILIGQSFFIASLRSSWMWFNEIFFLYRTCKQRNHERSGYCKSTFKSEKTYFKNGQYWIYHVLIWSVLLFFRPLLASPIRDEIRNTFAEYLNGYHKLNGTNICINVIDACMQIKLLRNGLKPQKNVHFNIIFEHCCASSIPYFSVPDKKSNRHY